MTDMPDRNAMTIDVGAMAAGKCRILFRRGVSDNIGRVGCGEGSWCDRGARRGVELPGAFCDLLARAERQILEIFPKCVIRKRPDVSRFFDAAMPSLAVTDDDRLAQVLDDQEARYNIRC